MKTKNNEEYMDFPGVKKLKVKKLKELLALAENEISEWMKLEIDINKELYERKNK